MVRIARNNVPYTIDDSNAECGYILVFDCSLGNFVFRSPCEILNECKLDVEKLIDWDLFNRCHIATSPLLSNMNPWYFIRVNSSWDCIEWVDPNNLSWLHDYRVRVTASDQEDFLQNKVVWTPGRVTVSVVWWSNQKLQIDVDESWLNWLLPANPACNKATLMYDINHWPYWACEEDRSDSYWAQRYLQTDYTGNSQTDPTHWPVNTDPNINYAVYNYVDTGWFEWNSNMNFTINAQSYAPSSFDTSCTWNVPGIKIIKSWLYAVWMNSDVSIWPYSVWNGIANIRLFVYTNNSKTIVVNAKEWLDVTWLIPWPGQWCSWTVSWVNFNLSWYNVVYLKEWEWLMMWMRVDRLPWSIDYAFTLHSQAMSLEPPYASWSAWKLSWTTFGCMLLSSSVLNAS